MLHNFKYFIVSRKDLSDQSKDMHLIFDSGQNVLFKLLSSDWDWDLGPGTWDLGPGTWDLGPRT